MSSTRGARGTRAAACTRSSRRSCAGSRRSAASSADPARRIACAGRADARRRRLGALVSGGAAPRPRAGGLVGRPLRAAGVETDAGSSPPTRCGRSTRRGPPRPARRPLRPRERSLSGLALMLGLRGRTHGASSTTRSRSPADYDAEFDDVFRHRRPVRDPTVYVSAPCATDPPARGGELVRARQRARDRRRRTGRPRRSG